MCQAKGKIFWVMEGNVYYLLDELSASIFLQQCMAF